MTSLAQSLGVGSPGVLVEAARNAVARHPDSGIEVAMEFFRNIHPPFLHESNDRLVKAGRSLVSLIHSSSSSASDLEVRPPQDEEPFPLEASIRLLVNEAEMIVGKAVKVPTVRFGKTGLRMPVVTLGCMRFQQAWGPRITTMDGVGSDCQDNLVAILRQAISYGITHIETARGYGCSELQLGVALQQLFRTGVCDRQDLIIQTKIAPTATSKDFRAMLETSFKNLQVEYVDLFAFHGLNMEHQWEWVFGKKDSKDEESCMDVIQEYKAAGKIHHIGFSTHGSTDLIKGFIETDAFEYVNLHYHAFGSYTASGGGPDGRGNLSNAKLLQERDMGVFIISPFDKGGRLYAPSKKVRRLTLPDAEPMTYMSQWVWNHHRLNDAEGGGALPQLHTYTVGAGRPSDLDQPAIAAYLHATQPEDTLRRVRVVTDRLRAEEERVLGKQWVETWWKGLPKNTGSKTFVEHNQIVWIYNSIKAFGMYEFGKARYKSFETNGAKWDWSLTPDENIDKLGRGGWGFVPGLPLDPNADYSEDLAKVPPENVERVIEAIAFVYNWCHEDKKKVAEEERINLTLRKIRRNFSVSTQLLRLSVTAQNELGSATEGKEGVDSADAEDQMPKEWETAYDMRPWPDFPDRTLP
jgi:uncharacterized protein